MKHTDFNSLIKKIKEQERKELIKAVIAHGGSYKWEDEEEKPIIAANVKYWENPIYIYNTRVHHRRKSSYIWRRKGIRSAG